MMEKKQVMSDQISGDGGLDFIPIDVYESRYDYKPAPVISYAGEFDYTPGLGFRSKILVSLPVDDDKVEKKKQIDVRPAFVDRDRFPGLTRDTSRLPATIIINNAKILFAQDPKEKRGFLYYHVWPILKDTEKFGDIPNSHQFEFSEGSQTGTQAFASPNTPSSVDLSVDDNEQTPVETPSESFRRPIGRKKEKMRKRLASDNSQVLASMLEDNRAILETLKRGEMKRDERFVQMDKDSAMRYQLMMIQAENNYHKLDLQRERQEKEFMEKDLNSINDPIEREYFRGKKMEILERRNRAPNDSGASLNQDDYGSFTQYQGGYGRDDLPPY